MKYYKLTSQQWDQNKELLPGIKGKKGRNDKNKRQFVEAILFRYKTGIPWGNLSNFFGDFRILNSSFSRWAKNGFWKMIFESLGQLPDNLFMMIGSSIVMAHQLSVGAREDKQK